MLTESARTNEHISIHISAKDSTMKENHVDLDALEAADHQYHLEQTPAMDGLLNQELAAREVNPMKLMTSLRVRFGIGRYEIQVCLRSRYLKNHLTYSSESGISTSFEYQHFYQRRRSKDAVGIDVSEDNIRRARTER